MKLFYIRRTLFAAVLLLLLTAACSSGARRTPTPIPTLVLLPSKNVPTSTPTPSLSATPNPPPDRTPVPDTPIATRTSTQIPITFTPTKVASPTMPPEIISDQCLQILDNLPADAVVNGTLILADYVDHSAQLWNIETDIKTRLPLEEGEDIWSFAVSPDKKWLAYQLLPQNNGASRIVIATDDGHTYKEIPMPREWWRFDWLNNKQLAVEVLGGQEDWITPLNILNPFTGAQQERILNFPGVYLDRVYWDMYSSSKSVYDPTLTRFLYPQTQADEPAILRDFQSGDELAYIPYSFFNTPKWSPDGKKAAIVSIVDQQRWIHAQEFYTVSWDGQVTRATTLTDWFSSVVIDDFNWSMDSQRIAFWLDIMPGNMMGWNLAVLDPSTGKVVNYCIHGDPEPDHDILRNDTAPIWSPDGTQLLVEARNPEVENQYWVILVDIVNRWAAKIAENLTPVGWMASP